MLTPGPRIVTRSEGPTPLRLVIMIIFPSAALLYYTDRPYVLLFQVIRHPWLVKSELLSRSSSLLLTDSSDTFPFYGIIIIIIIIVPAQGFYISDTTRVSGL